MEEKLGEWWSPQQVVLWLKRTYPDRPEMIVSHETIYLSLFIQGKGALRRGMATISSGDRPRWLVGGLPDIDASHCCVCVNERPFDFGNDVLNDG